MGDFELGTALSSNLFPLWLFENLFRLITPDLILELNVLKDRLKIRSFVIYHNN